MSYASKLQGFSTRWLLINAEHIVRDTKNLLGKHMLRRLKIYSGSEHPHAAQVNANKNLKESTKTGKNVKDVEVSKTSRKDEAVTQEEASSLSKSRNVTSGTRKRRSE